VSNFWVHQSWANPVQLGKFVPDAFGIFKAATNHRDSEMVDLKTSTFHGATSTPLAAIFGAAA